MFAMLLAKFYDFSSFFLQSSFEFKLALSQFRIGNAEEEKKPQAQRNCLPGTAYYRK